MQKTCMKVNVKIVCQSWIRDKQWWLLTFKYVKYSKTFEKTHARFVMETSTNFVLSFRKVFKYIDSWERFNEKLPTKKIATTWQRRASQTLTTNMLKESGKTLNFKFGLVSLPLYVKWYPVTCRHILKY